MSMRGRPRPRSPRVEKPGSVASPLDRIVGDDRRRVPRLDSPGRRREDLARAGCAPIARCKSADDVRVALALEHGLFGSMLAEFLARSPGVDLCATSDNDQDLARHDAHVVVLDVAGFLANDEVLRRTGASGTAARVLLIAAETDTDLILDALGRGAWGIVFQDARPEELVALLRAAARGLAWEDQDYAAQLLRSLRRGRLPSTKGAPGPALSERERQLIGEVADGASNADIARTLGLRPQSVKNRLSTIFDKLGVSSRLELALYAVHHRLTDRVPVDGRPARRR